MDYRGENSRPLIVIQKNPSRANKERSDSTVGKVVNWAKKRYFTSIIFLNLFCYITPDSGYFNDININSCMGERSQPIYHRFYLKIQFCNNCSSMGEQTEKIK